MIRANRGYAQSGLRGDEASTRAMVAGVSALCVFPPACSSFGPGSSLAVREALRRGLPVWCAGPQPSVAASWFLLRLAGLPGWVCWPQPDLPF